MGYTHYWEFKLGSDQKSYELAKKEIIEFITFTIEKENYKLADGMGKKGTFPSLNTFISFNGVEKDSHETFFLNNQIDSTFNFCKTARKPYDAVVIGCLLILKGYLKDDLRVSSDGDIKDLSNGIELLHKFFIYKDFLQDDFTIEDVIDFATRSFGN
jgi:hypothetical protein